MPKNVDLALKYKKQYQWSIIPCKQDKKPYIQWEKYQKEIASDDQIKEWWEKWPSANIAVVTGKVSNVCVVDIDTKEGMQEITKYIPDTIETPMQHTPKGGKHLFFRCEGEYPRNNSRIIPGCDFRGEAGFVLVYPSANGKGKSWFWDKALNLLKTEIAVLPNTYINYVLNNSIYIRGNKSNVVSNSLQRSPKVSRLFGEGLKDNGLFHLANCLVKGKMEEAYVKEVLRNCILSWPEIQTEKQNEKWIQDKINSALERAGRRERNIAEEVRMWVESQDGLFSVSDCRQESLIVSKEQKHAMRCEISKLKDRGVIEKATSKSGVYRIVDTTADDIDFINADDTPLDFTLPMGVTDYVELMEGNIVVVAGVFNAGKTAFLLNTVLLNQDDHKIIYYSSEMGASEMKKRLKKFNRPLNSWKFKAKERSSNFEDVIKDDGKIYMVDYLEVHEDFWKVGGILKRIYDKLKGRGLAIIALQKDRGKEYGLGQTRGLEKPRLYLNINPNEIEIVKGKNWKTEENPDKKRRGFKLVQGCKFIPFSEWEYKYKE